MSTSVKITCDVCGVEKKETNHWIAVILVLNYRTKIPFYFAVSLFGVDWFDAITSTSYNKIENHPDAKHLCGEGCLTKWIQANLYRLNPKTQSESDEKTK